MRGSDRGGLQEIHAPGAVLLQGAQLRVAGQVPLLTTIRFTPDEIVRVLRAGGVELTERVTVALDHGLVCWGIVADAPVPISLDWSSPFPQRPRPSSDPAITEESPVPEPVDPAPTVRLGNSANGLTIVACEGSVQRTSAPGTPGSVCHAEGDRMLRLVFVGGAVAGEVQRGEEAFARRRLRAFRQDRVLHARRLEQRLTALESGDPAIDRAFHWAKIRLDAAVNEFAGTGRMPRLPGSASTIEAMCDAAGAALAAGDREIALDLLRALGRAGVESASDQAAVSTLLQEYLAWTGDEPNAARIRSAIPLPPAPARDIELTGWADPALARRVSGWRPEVGAGSSALVRGVVEGLWGARPNAADGTLLLQPVLPGQWPEMALRRLRVGQAVLDLRLRRRPGRLVLRVELLQGPRPRLTVELPGSAAVTEVMLDDEVMGGSRVTFDVAGSHEVSFYLVEEARGPVTS